MSPECARGEQYNLKADRHLHLWTLLCHPFILISLEKAIYDELPSGFHHELVFQQGVQPCVCPHVLTLLQRSWSDKVAVRPSLHGGSAPNLSARNPSLHCQAKRRVQKHQNVLGLVPKQQTRRHQAVYLLFRRVYCCKLL
jgi:hypothetical protein